MLDFKGRRLPLAEPGRYTQLFFLDEATALAAGHRPCGYCRRDDFRRFKAIWVQANPECGLDAGCRIPELDARLYADRVTTEGKQARFDASIQEVPDGVLLDHAGVRLLWSGQLWLWSPGGYSDPLPAPSNATVSVLTPRSTVRAIAHGYTPAVHWTAAH
ncbi:MAG: hypothetical protein U0821_14180 [Chloroflexota bacterium]